MGRKLRHLCPTAQLPWHSEIGWDRREFTVVDQGEEGNSSWVSLAYQSPDGEMGEEGGGLG